MELRIFSEHFASATHFFFRPSPYAVCRFGSWTRKTSRLQWLFSREMCIFVKSNETPIALCFGIFFARA